MFAKHPSWLSMLNIVKWFFNFLPFLPNRDIAHQPTGLTTQGLALLPHQQVDATLLPQFEHQSVAVIT